MELPSGMSFTIVHGVIAHDNGIVFNRIFWFWIDIIVIITDCIEGMLPHSLPKHSVSKIIWTLTSDFSFGSYSLKASDIDHLSDEEVMRLKKSRKEFTLSPTPYGAVNISRITEHTVIKGAQDIEEEIEYASEAVALRVVAEHTSIPVPQVRRLVKGRSTTFIAMEYIPGKQLATVWPTLWWFGRLRIAFTIRSYVRQLRKIRHPRSSIPGPLGGPDEGPRTCQSPLFGPIVERRGPFATYMELTHFFNDRMVRWLKSKKDAVPSPDTLGTFDDSKPLVLTHQDLNPRNFIVGDDGHLWLVDWAWAGFYPEWFEFVAMRRQAENEEQVTGSKDSHWDAMIPFICGRYFEQDKWLNCISPALNWA